MASKSSRPKPPKPLPQFKIRAEFEVLKDNDKLRIVIEMTGACAVNLRDDARRLLESKLYRFGVKQADVEIYSCDEQYFAEKRPLSYDWVPAVRWTETSEEKSKAIRRKVYLPEDFFEATDLYGDGAK